VILVLSPPPNKQKGLMLHAVFFPAENTTRYHIDTPWDSVNVFEHILYLIENE